jgi:hypothetical protein
MSHAYTQSQTITLEAFEAQLRGTTVLWYIPQKATPQYPQGFIDQIVTDDKPFAKKCLILSVNTPPGWRLIDDFDIVMRPTTPTDWSVLLTCLNNCSKPVLVILAPYAYAPSALLQRLPQGTTFVSLKHLEEPNASPQTYQTVMLPQLSLDLIPNISFAQLLGSSNPSWNVPTVLRDLHGAGASLVASSIGDRLAQKQFYWYYTSKNASPSWRLEQIQNILLTIGSIS